MISLWEDYQFWLREQDDHCYVYKSYELAQKPLLFRLCSHKSTLGEVGLAGWTDAFNPDVTDEGVLLGDPGRTG